jgi:hypothetical protein
LITVGIWLASKVIPRVVHSQSTAPLIKPQQKINPGEQEKDESLLGSELDYDAGLSKLGGFARNDVGNSEPANILLSMSKGEGGEFGGYPRDQQRFPWSWG